MGVKKSGSFLFVRACLWLVGGFFGLLEAFINLTESRGVDWQ